MLAEVLEEVEEKEVVVEEEEDGRTAAWLQALDRRVAIRSLSTGALPKGF